MKYRTKHKRRTHIPDPGKNILAAMVRVAMEDMTAGQHRPHDYSSAKHFLNSKYYLSICDYLGIPPRVARTKAEEIIAANPIPVVNKEKLRQKQLRRLEREEIERRRKPRAARTSHI